jgi:glycosyltransferase involved in cell wall biosynthesis
MGRVASHWRKEFERRGYEFIHIGTEAAGRIAHPAMFPYAASSAYKRLRREASVLLVHEPASGIFTGAGRPTIVFSHGLERRGWELALQAEIDNGTRNNIRWRTRLFFPLWRLRQCDIGLRNAPGLLLINTQDSEFAQNTYDRSLEDIHVFRNGVYPSTLDEHTQPADGITALFLGSWLERKGIHTLIDAARILESRNVRINWLLAGTGADRDVVLSSWPESLRDKVEVVPNFSPDAEESLFARSNLFLLPSLFEGQPLSLLVAVETGRCCITTDCCGQRDLIRRNQNGLLHRPGDAAQLASLIEECASSESLRRSLGRNAKRTVQDRGWEHVTSEVAAFVESKVLRGGRR